MSLESDIRVLRQVPFLKPFEEEHLRLLAFGGENRRYRKGQPLFSEGEPAEGGLVIIRGDVRVPNRSRDEEGDVFSTGTLFGQRALLTRKPRSHSAIAVSDVEAVLIRRTLFVRVLSEFPPLAERLYAQMSAELRGLTEQAGVLVGSAD
ncbi:MAG: Crp/Fnr family transcriptional regulator [Devosiaceae bacterium]|nr:Crp/Fnr family transcriptional regulator [Devosiaceae bacterium MH13]